MEVFSLFPRFSHRPVWPSDLRCELIMRKGSSLPVMLFVFLPLFPLISTFIENALEKIKLSPLLRMGANLKQKRHLPPLP